MKEQGSIKFSPFPAFKDLVSGISRVSKSVLSMGTAGKIFPLYCLHLALSFWNLAQDKSHGLGRGSATGNLSLESRSRSNSQKDKYSYCTLQTTGDLLAGFK